MESSKKQGISKLIPQKNEKVTQYLERVEENKKDEIEIG